MIYYIQEIKKEGNTMFKLQFFVSCQGWKTGGYENTHYFKTKKEAEKYLKKHGLKLISLEKIPFKEFANDYIG
jgi:hypothetical protein